MGVGQVGYILFIYFIFIFIYLYILYLYIYILYLYIFIQGVLHVLGQARVRFIRVGATQVMIT